MQHPYAYSIHNNLTIAEFGFVGNYSRILATDFAVYASIGAELHVHPLSNFSAVETYDFEDTISDFSVSDTDDVLVQVGDSACNGLFLIQFC